ncbi:hypothetical protein BGY98DRAFT_1088170 [Russula aff. rugulosa BPL654]|nr:hypothetical protein BGY98DRAFT_1088170 [Russula aff. rugulosa BPL654]
MSSTFLFLAFLFPIVLAQVATPRFGDCFSGNPSLKLNVSTIYAQITTSQSFGSLLNITVLGQSPQPIEGTANGSSDLATLFLNTEILTFNVFDNNSYFCQTLRPPSPLPSPDNSSGLYCPIPAGPFAFSASAPLESNHELATLQTSLRAVDPFSNELLCVNIATTPLRPGALGSVYGHAKLMFYGTVLLCVAYWLLVAIARLSSAWARRSGWSRSGFWPRVENFGFVVASAVSGEGLSKSPALMRFVTPSMRDVFFHTQWCAALAMVAVEWPEFIYPLLTQTAWSTLSYNVTLTQSGDSHWKHWYPLTTPVFQPPSNFSDQLSDRNSPLFIDTNISNILFTLPRNATSGISSFAYTVGLRPQDLFPVCLTLFLSIIATTVVLSLFVWALDSAVTFIIHVRSNGPPKTQYGSARNPHLANKESLDGVTSLQTAADEERSHSSHFLFKSPKFTQSPRKRLFRLRPDFSSFHFTILQGNLVRILMLFHLPVTIFSSYQLTIGREATGLSMAFAALSLIAFSILIPILLIFRLFMNSTSKLYDETWTLLALGPLYNHYRHGSQLFACIFFATSLASGITIGFGQKSGIAQAVIILLIEVVTALVTSIWLPWGHGASMGLISFLFCVARIVVAVLLVILTPTVSIGTEAGQWVACVILLIIGIIYLALVILLTIKIIEGVTRVVGKVGFERSRHTVDSGLIGVCGLLGCCGSRKQRTTLPLTGPRDSTPTQSAPPSVFRPEHALRPYREENDDDTGFIMGAWRPFPRPGIFTYGGGRSHFDTPYSIATGSAYTFPSASLDTPQRHSHESNPSVTPSLTNAERQPYPSLPPGAMAPHVRRKSQSAVIEHVPAPPKAAVAPSLPSSQLAINAPSTYRRHSQLSEVVSPVTDDDPHEVSQPKKRYWFQLRKPRRHSDGDEARPGEEVLTDKPADTGRSFVVLRDRKPSQQPLPSGSGSAGAGEEAVSDATATPPAKSFVVLRGKDPTP